MWVALQVANVRPDAILDRLLHFLIDAPYDADGPENLRCFLQTQPSGPQRHQ